MFETSGSRLCQQHSPWESSAFENCMIAPFQLRQHEFLPASINPSKGLTNLGLSGLEFHDSPKRALTHEANGLIGQTLPHYQTPFLPPNGHLKEQSSLFSARTDVHPSANELPSCPQEKRFLIFDQCGDETRLIFSSLSPRVQNLTTAQTKYPAWNPQDAPASLFGGNRFPAENQQANKAGEVWIKAPIIHEESGENAVVEEGSEMREDTEEINALLYSDDDDGFDSNGDRNDDDEDDEASTGHSPLAMGGDCEKLEEPEVKNFDEVDSFDITSKRQKTLDGESNELPLLRRTTMSRENLSYENIHGEDMICGLDEELGPSIGRKRPRTEKIRGTLKVLEGIIPGVKSKDPLAILDEAISYLKCLKHNAQVMSVEDPDSSSCYGPSN